jgi:hypothetical protein
LSSLPPQADSVIVDSPMASAMATAFDVGRFIRIMVAPQIPSADADILSRQNPAKNRVNGWLNSGILGKQDRSPIGLFHRGTACGQAVTIVGP